MASYLSALGVLFQPVNFIMMYLCSLVGCVLGAIPGLSGGLGITLILPMTFALNTNLSFAMLLGMYVGGVSGSFIAAVLVGIPGSAASIGTCYDGYPMTQRGKAARALTIGITGSFIGTMVSIIVATLCSTFIADVALMLGPWEYFSLCLMAITMVVGLSNGSIFKGLLAAFFGLWLSTVGSDMVTNQLRFTFKNTNLYGGISVICLLMGTFALQQVATSYAKNNLDMPEVDAGSLKGFGLTFKDFKDNLKVILTSLFIGLWIGFLPGMGSGISNLIAYGQAKKMSKHPEKFGTGIDEGIWATEVANNAGVGGAIIPMIALGIPGDATTVLLMSAMTIHGLQAGPMFIKTNPAACKPDFCNRTGICNPDLRNRAAYQALVPDAVKGSVSLPLQCHLNDLLLRCLLRIYLHVQCLLGTGIRCCRHSDGVLQDAKYSINACFHSGKQD